MFMKLLRTILLLVCIAVLCASTTSPFAPSLAILMLTTVVALSGFQLYGADRKNHVLAPAKIRRPQSPVIIRRPRNGQW
jgi:hypothetical protein